MFPVTPSMDEQFSGVSASDGPGLGAAASSRSASARRLRGGSTSSTSGASGRGSSEEAGPGASTSAGGRSVCAATAKAAQVARIRNETRDGMVAKHARRVVRRNERDGGMCRAALLSVYYNFSEKKIRKKINLPSSHRFAAFTPVPCSCMIFSKTTLTPMSTSGTPLPGRVDAPTK